MREWSIHWRPFGVENTSGTSIDGIRWLVAWLEAICSYLPSSPINLCFGKRSYYRQDGGSRFWPHFQDLGLSEKAFLILSVTRDPSALRSWAQGRVIKCSIQQGKNE